MKYKNPAFLIIIFILWAFILILPATGKNKDKSPAADDMEKVENNLIIDGLKLNSEKPPVDSDTDIQKGTIVYDDTFDDNITRFDKSDKNSRRKTEEKRNSKKSPSRPDDAKPEKIIDRLREKDKRWHLIRHRISGGENLWDISKKYDTDYRLIIRINDIRNPDKLREGKTIDIPNRMGVEYKVKKGDSLFGISRMFGVDLKKITSQNYIINNKIKTGQALFIPGASPVKEKESGEAPAEKNAGRSAKIAKNNAAWKLKFSWPLRGRLTSAFGGRINPISNLRRFHCGIDIAASEGTPVKAAQDGRVIFSGWKDGYGWVVILRHANGYITVYAHNLRNVVAEGDNIKAGNVVSLSGNSGAVTGPHLHFELRKYLTPLNPLRLLK
ncbi:MAG: peptidoglycan DD-metalloendopeptidase family protein [Spirochaetes bacterium]|jgi:murein DD-endopeptidase MepM/ murein hydrolase activator NlpD|nr:peptidoglycan DD-metalloendopeptidase family protein [Spirochaetota bacterium]